ncbi:MULTISPECIES: hypothetical protein [unclassified Frigoribacterium]|uniref:hypothetical protein n=1 Tax=unclassified Frigoribacterium TaxID=2627005 RepID=UPI0006F9409B|nr:MULTISPECIES: hypothetical protein [unclassified Frigoribacterium]KQO84509.1 hypothetical protein ASF17_03190 [Frigoribacterium sp. Leaf263]KQR63831.1 hypothetical protein ASF89_12030 [Frigoribacterium sp. Leaf172]
MLINKLRIDSQMFYLEPDEDIEALKKQILETARGVADFIVFTPIGLGKVSVLMTPHTPVRFEEQEHTSDELQEWEDETPRTDYDLDFDAFGGSPA